MDEHERKRSEGINQTLAAFSRPTRFRNSLVGALEGLVTLEPYPACASCPAGFWFWDTDLVCFCKSKKDYTWGRGARPVLACAEREALLIPPQAAATAAEPRRGAI